MLGKKILAERPVASSAAKDLLGQREKEELNYEQRTALDYLNKMIKLKQKKAEEMMEELMKAHKIKPEIAVKIIDLLPRDEEDVRAIFAKERFVLTKEEITTILKAVEGSA